MQNDICFNVRLDIKSLNKILEGLFGNGKGNFAYRNNTLRQENLVLVL